MGRGRIGTPTCIISLGFPQGEIRSMLKKALKKNISNEDRSFLDRVRCKKKLSQLERQRIRRIYLNN